MRNWLHDLPSNEAYHINHVLYKVQHDRDEEARFFAGPKEYLATADLPERARSALMRTDVGALYRLGANPYLLRAYCLQLRMPEADYLAALRSVAGPNHG